MAQISEKQDGSNTCVIIETIYPPGYHLNGFMATHGLNHITHGCLLSILIVFRNLLAKFYIYIIYKYTLYIYIYIYIYIIIIIIVIVFSIINVTHFTLFYSVLLILLLYLSACCM